MVLTFNTLSCSIIYTNCLLFFVKNKQLPDQIANNNKPLYNFLINKWYFDELYEVIFIKPCKKIGLFFWKFCDGKLIDGFGPDGISSFIKKCSIKANKFQSGFIYQYAFVMLLGFSALLTFLIINKMNFPILSSLILLPIIGALFLFFTKDKDGNNLTAKYVSLFTTIVNFLISIYLWISFDQSTSSFQFIEDREWINGFINYKVGVDGISILFIILTTFITPLCIISVNNTVKVRLRDFLIAILIMESFMIGVFCALDLVVFYLFFEAGLIPMFLIIGIWGGPKRVYSAFKFFLYTLLGSVLMLVAIISIYWISGTTDVIKLYELGIDAKYQNLLWLAFFSSFAVKTPMWPVHTWLPDAHVEAPTAGSVLLAAILLKMAGYGFIRFSLGLFPIASEIFTPLIYTLSVIAIVFTSLIALMQEDMKKLIAYSSVAHMGFVTLGIFTIQQQGIEGSIIQMISHGLVSAALFLMCRCCL